MAHQHFRRGFPRSGQWVLVDGSRLAIHAPESSGRMRRGPTVLAPDDASPEVLDRIEQLSVYLIAARGAGDKAGARKIEKQLADLGATVKAQGDLIVDAPKLELVSGPIGKTKCRVEFVDANGDYDLAAPGGGWAMVELDRLTPLLDRGRVPAKRLAKMDPNWQPSP